jgi:hypothetical protein
VQPLRLRVRAERGRTKARRVGGKNLGQGWVMGHESAPIRNVLRSMGISDVW